MDIKIHSKEVVKAKADTLAFDKQKSYNKFICKNNYIGLLGEMVLDRYLTEHNITHTWVPFIKTSTSEPDFIINGITFDIKTSYDGRMWVTQKTPHDIYIGAQIKHNNKVMSINGWLTRRGVCVHKLHKNKHTTNNNISYAISIRRLMTIDMLVGVFPPSPTGTQFMR